MQVSNTDMSSLLMNMQNMQVQEAMKQVEVAVASKVGLETSNVDVASAEVSAAMAQEVAAISYSASGVITDLTTNSVDIRA